MLLLHSGDFHIQDSRIDECRKVLYALCESADKVSPDLILLAGDLTHRYDTKLDSKTGRLLFEVVYHLAGVAPVAVVGGTVFHDGQIPTMLLEMNLKNLFVACTYPQQIVFADGALVPIEKWSAYQPEATISLVPAPTKKFLEASGTMAQADATIASGIGMILADFGAKAKQFPMTPHIVVGHWSIGGAYISEHQMMIGRDIEVSRDQVALAQADLVCLGHIHRSQQIGENIFYSGSTYSIDAGELEDKGFWYHSLDKKSLAGSEFAKLPATKRLVIKADFTDEDDDGISELDAVLYTYSDEEIRDNLVKVSFRAYKDDAEKLVSKDIESFFLNAGAKEVKVEIIRVPRDNVRCAEYFKAVTLRDKLIQQAELRGKPDDFDEILAKADLLESTDPEQIFEALPGP